MAALTWRLGALLCSAGFTMIVSADQIKIPAETGQPVTLPCKLASSSQVIVVQWSRTDLGSDYVLLYRDGRIDPFNQHQSFKNRVDLQSRNMEDGDVSLVLRDVRTEDGGKYECRVVQTGTGRRKNLISTISLEVAAPPPGHYAQLKADQPNQEEDDKHSETAEKEGGTQETPSPTPPAGIKAEVNKDGENDDLEEQKAPYSEPLMAASVQRSLNHEKTGQNQAAKNQVAKNQAEKNQVVESRAVPGVIASFSVIAVLVAVVVSVIIWRKRRPDLPPEKEQTAMI